MSLLLFYKHLFRSISHSLIWLTELFFFFFFYETSPCMAKVNLESFVGNHCTISVNFCLWLLSLSELPGRWLVACQGSWSIRTYQLPHSAVGELIPNISPIFAITHLLLEMTDDWIYWLQIVKIRFCFYMFLFICSFMMIFVCDMSALLLFIDF